MSLEVYVMVNWEQIINEMDLPELPEPPIVANMFRAPNFQCSCGGAWRSAGASCDFGVDPPVAFGWWKCMTCGCLTPVSLS